CSTDAAASLFAQLGGTPDAGGTWSGPSPVVGGMIDPATMSAGVYTYTVTGTAPCPNEQATVTVTINTPPDPGTPGAITLCSTDAPASLFGQLGGTPDAGGTWSGPSPVVGGMIDPATMSAGVHLHRERNGALPQRNGHGDRDHQHAAQSRNARRDHALQHRCSCLIIRAAWRNT
ncbi:MAG: hypothetical protein IPL52_06980, partial [Flavobacteriales bacterium]|nr:hypothetical protein [Flavobacteriales bacterium]